MSFRYNLTKDIFVIPKLQGEENCNLVYAPLKGVLFTANDSFCSALSSLHSSEKVTKRVDINLANKLSQLNLLESDEATEERDIEKFNRINNSTFPTHAIFLLSDCCNLRCKYCYASSEGGKNKTFDRQMAIDTIKFVIDNANRINESECVFSFHGGGEPMLQFELIRDCINFANEYKKSNNYTNIVISPMIVTNGCISESEADWLASNMKSIQVSFDGPKAIHDDQRPYANGGSSYEKVLATINRLIDQNVPNLIIKSTISQKHVNEMPEIAKFLCENIRVERFHFGAVLNYGRAPQTGYCEPDAKTFIEMGLEAQHIAKTYGKNIVLSLAQETFPSIRDEYCGVTSPNFAITIDGDITACYEVLNSLDARSKRYYYGKYDISSRTFVFNSEKISELVNATAETSELCQNCFIKWQCAGDCQSRFFAADNDDRKISSDFRCEVNRTLVLDKMKNILL